MIDETRDAAFTYKQMSEFVSKREHLGRLKISAIHENKRRIFVNEGKALKLIGVQLAVGIVANNSGKHDQHAGAVRLFTQKTKRVSPVGLTRSPVSLELKGITQCVGYLVRVLAVRVGADKVERIATYFDEIVPHPCLAASHEINGLKQIWAGTQQFVVATRAKVRYGQTILGRFRQVEVAKRSMRVMGQPVSLGNADSSRIFPFKHPLRLHLHFAGELTRF